MVSNPQESEELEKQFIQEREQASLRIKEASDKHEKKILEYLQKNKWSYLIDPWVWIEFYEL